MTTKNTIDAVNAWLDDNLDPDGVESIDPLGLDVPALQSLMREVVQAPGKPSAADLNALYDAYPDKEEFQAALIAEVVDVMRLEEQLAASDPSALEERLEASREMSDAEVDLIIEQFAETDESAERAMREMNREFNRRELEIRQAAIEYGATDPEKFKFEYEAILNREAAQRAIKAAGQEDYAAPEGMDLSDLLDMDFKDEQWIVQDLIEDGQQILIYSAAKTGKSNWVQELMSALSTGAPFIDKYETTAPTGKIGLVDVELHPRKLAERLGKREWQAGNMKVYSLRGVAPGQSKLMKLDLSSETSRNEWVQRWKADGIEYLILDPLSALIREAGMSEWNEAGLALRYLQQMTAEAGIRAHIVVTHASSKQGGMDNGPRGDSAMLDVPDNVWKLVNNKDKDTMTLTTIGRTESVGIEARWLPGGRFDFLREFDPYAESEASKSDDGPVSPTAIGSRVVATMYARAHRQAHEAGIDGVNFESLAWRESDEIREVWPQKANDVIELMQAESGHNPSTGKPYLSVRAAKEMLNKLKDPNGGCHFLKLIGRAQASRYVPAVEPGNTTAEFPSLKAILGRE